MGQVRLVHFLCHLANKSLASIRGMEWVGFRYIDIFEGELFLCKCQEREFESKGKADKFLPKLPGFQRFFISFARMPARSSNWDI